MIGSRIAFSRSSAIGKAYRALDVVSDLLRHGQYGFSAHLPVTYACLLDRVLLHRLLCYGRVSAKNGIWHGDGPCGRARTDFDGFLLHVFALEVGQLIVNDALHVVFSYHVDRLDLRYLIVSMPSSRAFGGSRVPSSFSLLSSLVSAMMALLLLRLEKDQNAERHAFQDCTGLLKVVVGLRCRCPSAERRGEGKRRMFGGNAPRLRDPPRSSKVNVFKLKI